MATALIAADATVAVAALVTWHERHRAASAAIEGALARKALVLPALVLVESYAILTSLPAQHRLAHPDAFHLLRNSFGTARIATPRKRDLWPALRQWSVSSLGGNAAFDALIVDIARAAGAKTLLTFRRQDLERVGGSGIEIVEPV